MNRSIRHASWSSVLLLSVLLGTGCHQGQTTTRMYYEPQPALVEVLNRSAGASQQVPLTVLASVQGVRSANASTGQPATLEVRMRFENHGPATVLFDPGSLQLVTGALRSFPPPRASPPTPVQIPAAQSQTVSAAFPLPAGLSIKSPELDHLRLRWNVTINGQSVPQTALFVRDNESDYASNDPLAG